MQSPLQLENYEYIKFSFAVTKPEGEPDYPERIESIPHRSGISYNVLVHADDPTQYKLEFAYIFEPESGDAGVHLVVEMDGFFKFSNETSLETREKMVRLNGCTIMYGLLRGHVEMIVALSPLKRHILPLINMVKVVEDIEAARKKSGEKRGENMEANPKKMLAKPAAKKRALGLKREE